MIQKTSFEAYQHALKNLGARQQVVFDEIKKHEGITNLMLSRELNLPINTITPRVKELRDMGLVVFMDDMTVDPITKKRSIRWAAAYPQELF